LRAIEDVAEFGADIEAGSFAEAECASDGQVFLRTPLEAVVGEISSRTTEGSLGRC
jgi:hypothetical protein